MGVGMTGKDGTNTLEAPPGGQDGTNTMAASPRGGGGGGRIGQTPERHPRGGGGANTLVQPHYPTPTQSVNPAGARGQGG